MKTKITGVIIIACLSGACMAGSKNAKVKLYQDELDIMQMRGKDYKEVTELLGSWEFGVLDTWEAVNPDENKLDQLDNREMGRFSEEEKQNVFKETGNYNVIYLLKLESRESASIGEISGMGLSYRKDNTIDIEKYILIRIAFRNKKLIQFKIWGDITTSSVSGFKIKRHSE
jgi:hypothetical protein